jgi:cytochrome c-type biogenesis protein CcmF
MGIGDLILYASLAAGLAGIVALYKGVEKQARLFTRLFAALLLADFLLLMYYFVVTDLTVSYVWQFSSKSLPLMYKLSAVLAGQQGSLLYWALLIGLGSLWLNEKGASGFIRKSQALAMSIGIYFIGLTLLNSPFKSISQAYPELPKGYVPSDGAGLNPLLIDPWMAVHPPLIFIGYAALTVPFALSVMYLYRSTTGNRKGIPTTWLADVALWCRTAWLFLLLGIAVGGFWAYKVLGWGGFWAWDPVETSSLVPWLLLTGALHALRETRAPRGRYEILAPALVSFSFVLVIYATLVTRSGYFESIHAFDTGNVGFYLLLLVALSAIASLILPTMAYLKASSGVRETGYFTRSNVFYGAILLFILLTFVSFFGVTFPATAKLLTGNKYAVGMAFFNLWSYPFFIAMMLLAGLGLNFRKNKARMLKEFAFFSGLTLIAAFIKPTDAWNIIDYSSAIGPDKPLLYTFIGSASVLSFLPPSLYILYSAFQRARKINFKIRELSLLSIHVGIVFVIIGAAFSALFSQEYSVFLGVNGNEKVDLKGSPYKIELLDYRQQVEYSNVVADIPGLSIGEINRELEAGAFKPLYTVHGFVEDKIDVDHSSYLKLVEGDASFWIATDNSDIPKYTTVVATGMLIRNFRSKFLDRSFDVIMFSSEVVPFKPRKEVLSSTQEVALAVYRGSEKVAQGTAASIEYSRSDVSNVKRVMIDRGLLKDFYIIFNGSDGNALPVTLKVVPLVNFLWIGILLFAIGMSALILSDVRSPAHGVGKD